MATLKKIPSPSSTYCKKIKNKKPTTPDTFSLNKHISSGVHWCYAAQVDELRFIQKKSRRPCILLVPLTDTSVSPFVHIWGNKVWMQQLQNHKKRSHYLLFSHFTIDFKVLLIMLKAPSDTVCVGCNLTSSAKSLLLSTICFIPAQLVWNTCVSIVHVQWQ